MVGYWEVVAVFLAWILVILGVTHRGLGSARLNGNHYLRAHLATRCDVLIDETRHAIPPRRHRSHPCRLCVFGLWVIVTGSLNG